MVKGPASLLISDSEEYSAGKNHNWMWDISGAFGDLGVFFPIAVALIAKNGFNPTALFLMAGFFYIASAYYFKITMPVQPLKAMSVIAIATGLNFEVINAAGITMGFILLILSLTGFSIRLGALFPLAVIRGIQFGLGLLLVKASVTLINTDFMLAIIAGMILITTISIMKKIPPLIPLLILVAGLSLKEIQWPSIGPLSLAPVIPDLKNLCIGFSILVLPQIGLTLSNAVVATESTAKLLYGPKAEKLNLRSIPLSMGIANLISGIMGGAPMCHGSGGLTAHRKFGAKNEKSGYIIGFTFVTLAILFGGSILSIVSVFPKGILAVMLCYVGIQHAFLIKDIIRDKTNLWIAFAVALSGFITGNLTIGCLLGIGIHYGRAGGLKTAQYVKKKIT
jgi:sulfate permease, SulP family